MLKTESQNGSRDVQGSYRFSIQMKYFRWSTTLDGTSHCAEHVESAYFNVILPFMNQD